MTQNEQLKDGIVQRYQNKVAGQPMPDEDNPVFSFVATKPIPDAVFTFADGIGFETVALCVLLTRTNVEEMRQVIVDCWAVAEDRDVELRVYLGYAGNILWKRPGYERLEAHVEANEIDAVLLGKRPSPFAPTESERTDYIHFWRSFFALCDEKPIPVESIEPPGAIVSTVEPTISEIGKKS